MQFRKVRDRNSVPSVSGAQRRRHYLGVSRLGRARTLGWRGGVQGGVAAAYRGVERENAAGE